MAILLTQQLQNYCKWFFANIKVLNSQLQRYDFM